MCFNSKNGFTLVELMMVVVLIGALATLGIANYGIVIEKGRSSEARRILGELREAQEAYHFEYDWFTADPARLGVDVPWNSCNSSFYFFYSAMGVGMNSFQVRATRCTGGGKSPNYNTPYAFSLDQNGALTPTTPAYAKYL